MTVATLLLLALPAMAAPEDEEQDRIGGELIFEIVKVLASTPHLDTEVRGTLGSSLEFSFLLLQRSPHSLRRRLSVVLAPYACVTRS